MEGLKTKLHALMNKNFLMQKQKMLELHFTQSKLAETYFKQPMSHNEAWQNFSLPPPSQQPTPALEIYTPDHQWPSINLVSSPLSPTGKTTSHVHMSTQSPIANVNTSSIYQTATSSNTQRADDAMSSDINAKQVHPSWEEFGSTSA